MKKQHNTIKHTAAITLMIFMGFLGLLAGQSSLEVSGDVKAKVTNAQADVFYMKAIKIWRVTIETPFKEYRKTGKKVSAHIFFSRDFTLETKKYPIAFSYLNKKDTLGGSFFNKIKGQRIPGFSFDTKGELTITKIGDTVEGTFSYKTYTSDSKPPQKSVIVSGTFSIPKKPGFPKGPPPQ